MESKNIFNESMNELLLIKENLKKQVELDYIKENERKLDGIVEKLITKYLNEDEVSSDTEDNDSDASDEVTSDVDKPEEVSTDKTDSVEDKPKNSIDMIDAIINSIDIDKALANDNGVDATQIDIDTEGEPTSLSMDGDDFTIHSDGEDTTDSIDSDDVEQTDNTETDDSLSDEDKELEEFYNKHTQMKTPKTEEMIKDDKTSMSDEEMSEMLKEMEDELDQHGEQKPDVHTPTEETHDTGLDEEEKFMKELEEMSEEELEHMMNEIMGEDSDLDTDLADDGAQEELADELTEEADKEMEEGLEEGMSAANQTQKVVGTKGASVHDGRPDRRSNMNESFKKDFEALKETVAKVMAVNESLKKENTKLLKQTELQSKSLDTIKKKLYEAALVSHKTAGVNQLFLENSLNQNEKNAILAAFGKVETLEDSKNTFERLNESFSNKKVIKESIEDRITKTKIQSGAVVTNETKFLKESANSEIAKKFHELSGYKMNPPVITKQNTKK
jgi:hypothetical protein